jgi:5S rRNA maturation endonuclease (ribonuclease M5)
MSTKQKDRIEKIEQIIAKLVMETSKGVPVVVEGKKDADNLALLGVQGMIITAKTGGKSFLYTVSEIEQSGARRVILLLDFDRRGKEGTKRLILELERLRIIADARFWRELAGLVSRDIQCIESLPSYLETLKQKAAK